MYAKISMKNKKSQNELIITVISNSMLNPIYVKLFEDVKTEQILSIEFFI